jgi:radical SAM superfamily enzyme YgiQ (UPF0313 family)
MAFSILCINPPYKSGKGYNREGRCTQEASFWSTPWPPLSLATIAAVLREGNNVRILDCPAQRVSERDLLDFVRKKPPDIVISSVSTETIDSDLAILGKIKDTLKNSVLIIFGIHASVFAEDILKNSAVDFVVRDEPEETIRELVGALKSGLLPDAIKGITYRSSLGQVVATGKREFVQDLDALPFPAWDLVDLGRYRLPFSSNPFIIINTSRGCPFRCSFCNAQTYYGSSIRIRSVRNILDELEFSTSRYGIKDVFFWGDTFTLVREQVKNLCAGLIQGKFRIRWVANSRVDTVDEEILMLMKKAGCWLLSFGIESGDEQILKSCGKNISLEKTWSAVRMTKAAGIKVAGHFILGLPGETEETAGKTIRLAKKLGLDFAHFYSAVPYPGSLLYEQAAREGWIQGKNWDQFRQSEFVMELPTISAERLYKLRRKAYYAFYLKPKTLKTALSLMSSRLRIFRGSPRTKRL